MEILDFIVQISFIQGLILIIGVILVIVEMFHPGFGAPGITGAILIIIGIIFIASTFQQALILIVLVLAILGIALSIILHSATKGKLSRSPLILKHSRPKINRVYRYGGSGIFSWQRRHQLHCFEAIRSSGF